MTATTKAKKKPTSKPVTVTDVAKAAGVSPREARMAKRVERRERRRGRIKAWLREHGPELAAFFARLIRPKLEERFAKNGVVRHDELLDGLVLAEESVEATMRKVQHRGGVKDDTSDMTDVERAFVAALDELLDRGDALAKSIDALDDDDEA